MYLRENWQKNIRHTQQILAIKRVGSVELSESVKKEDLPRKSFSENVEWSSKKFWKMISPNIKTDVKQEINKLVAVS